ncbi:MAG: protein-export chaperone SecB [Methylophagaceae bacterium]|jgi:preprotein translocase subunit SecB|tara:strand:- start:692 stop:1168 length:477 start_codon:yes stop_codon:yes gene_type:complete
MAEEKAAAEKQQPQFMIQKIYTKDISFETPSSPEVFREEWKPELDLQLTNEYKQLDDNNHDVTLVATVTAKLGDKTAFLIEVKQSGIFSLIGYSNEEIAPLIGNHCPTILFPYIREVISDIVLKGGFPQLVLAPVNFDALYMNQVEQAKQAAAKESTH